MVAVIMIVVGIGWLGARAVQSQFVRTHFGLHVRMSMHFPMRHPDAKGQH